MKAAEPATTSPQENRNLALLPPVWVLKQSPIENRGAGWPEEVRQKIGEVYEPVLQWLQDRAKIDIEDAREALHDVLKKLGHRQISRIRRWEHYLTRAAVRRFRRSKAKRPGKLRILPFSDLSKADRESVYAIRAPGLTPDEELAEREILDILRKEVEKLPPRQRQVLTLELDRKTPQEIQAILGLRKLSTVYSNRQKAIAKLQRIPVFREDERFCGARDGLLRPRTGRGGEKPPRRRAGNGKQQ